MNLDKLIISILSKLEVDAETEVTISFENGEFYTAITEHGICITGEYGPTLEQALIKLNGISIELIYPKSL